MAGARKSSKAAKKPQSTKHKKVPKKLQRASTISETVKSGKQFLAKQNEVKSPSKKPSTPKPAAETTKPAAPVVKKVEKVVVKKVNKKLPRSRTINETLKTAKTFLSSKKPKLTRKSTIQQTVEASKPVVKSRKSSKGRR